MAALHTLYEHAPSQLIDLENKDEYQIGRSPECDLVLAQQGVSRKHATLRRSGRDFFLLDHKSRNKTYLNGQLIEPEQLQLLHEGDKISICDIEFTFYYNSPLPSSGPQTSIDWVVDQEKSSTLHTVDAQRSSDSSDIVRPEVKLEAILEITRSLSSSLQIEEIAPKILDTLLGIFPQAERGFLVLLSEVEPRPVIRRAYHKVRPYRRSTGRSAINRPMGDEGRLSLSTTILNTIVKQRKAVLSRDAGKDMGPSESIADLCIRSFMCAPLLTPENRPLGILQLDTTDHRHFREDDLDLLVAVADQASIAVQNADLHEALVDMVRIERDLRLAEQVQRRFLPQSVPTIPGYEFYAHYQAAYEVGGDYYDFVPLLDGRLAVALGDVAGKGVSAALLMAKFSGDARFCILTKPEVGPTVDTLNSLLYEAGFEERFITLCLGVLDPSKHEFTYASAGHLPILVRRANGQVDEYGPNVLGFPLGIVNESTYKQETFELKPGDVAVIYSDGVTDGRRVKDEEIFDTVDNPRLRKYLATLQGGAQSVGRAIIQHLREFSAGHVQMDDITLVCFGPVPEPRP